MKIPRKLKKKIPSGLYCYNFLDVVKNEDTGGIRIKIKPCPFYKHIEDTEGHCNLINHWIPDMLKFCKYNWDKKGDK